MELIEAQDALPGIMRIAEQQPASVGRRVLAQRDGVAADAVGNPAHHRSEIRRNRRRGLRRSRRSEEHTSELQSLMRISYAVFCLKKKKNKQKNTTQKANKHHKNISL